MGAEEFSTVGTSPTDEAGRESTRVTLQMVAEEAGCSLSTASKSLSGRTDISSDTRGRVAEVAARLGYVPRLRRAATVERTASVTIAFDSYGSLYSNEVFFGALLAVARTGLELDVAMLSPQFAEEPTARQWISAKKRAGHMGAVLVTSALSDALADLSEEYDFPLVSIDPKSTVNPNIVSIGAASWVGASSATDHLIGLGHSRIAFAGLASDAAFALERFAGFRSAIERAGLSVDPLLIFHGNTDYQCGFDLGEKIARMSRPPTAVVCVCDVVAFGIIEAGRQRGMLVPQDLSVVGFDDVMPARWSSPSLTTVRQPLQRMGGLAVRTLLRLIEGREPESHLVQLATNLIVRKSTAPPATRDAPS